MPPDAIRETPGPTARRTVALAFLDALTVAGDEVEQYALAQGPGAQFELIDAQEHGDLCLSAGCNDVTVRKDHIYRLGGIDADDCIAVTCQILGQCRVTRHRLTETRHEHHNGRATVQRAVGD